ncbi:Uncharacterised protein [Mycobacteroides abscessus subsp. abscessus]|nr:Uncharacterised protein [Mycobacteroides abscessus subsp. abscessus]SIK14533.1 Uncharacterised protein [Mycobacteroides abscessus subsp. abscessus]SIN25190.1 Uncharacterised protein [Mycobacteroides abscessus subsp. abscessus]SLI51771.1 Uncharacterised protein [Mycobacteroides abscessus subsp. abscessus]
MGEKRQPAGYSGLDPDSHRATNARVGLLVSRPQDAGGALRAVAGVRREGVRMTWLAAIVIIVIAALRAFVARYTR